MTFTLNIHSIFHMESNQVLLQEVPLKQTEELATVTTKKSKDLANGLLVLLL